MKKVDLQILGIVLLLTQIGAAIGCGILAPQRESNKARAGQVSRSSGISEEKAVFIASREASERGWKNFEVFGKPVQLADGEWQVLLVRIPRVVGGHARVDISADGKETSWTGGM